MDDKRRTAGNDEEIDLSGMINEYSQDNELRKKIEELKKQKEDVYKRQLRKESVISRIFVCQTGNQTFTCSCGAVEHKRKPIRWIRNGSSALLDQFRQTSVVSYEFFKILWFISALGH